MLVPVFICTYFVFIVIVNASVYFYVMFIFPSDQFLLKVQTEVFCVNDLFSVGITPMFSPPEGDTSMFRCFATIAIPFYLSLMTLSCSKRVFLPMGLCIFFLSPSEPPSQCTHSHLQYKHTPSKLLHL